jgi:hypothetical protein
MVENIFLLCYPESVDIKSTHISAVLRSLHGEAVGKTPTGGYSARSV